jgi:predicted dehydrogenase
MTTHAQGDRLRIGVIGCGHWGKNYVRVFSSMTGAELVGIADSAPDKLAALRRTCPEVPAFADHRALIERAGCDAVVVATTASTHHDVAADAVSAGLHALVEKPFTLTVADAADLIRKAERRRLTLMVAHTFLYNPSVRRIQALIREGVVGDVYYLKARRTHLGLVRDDVNAIWDLAPHDISMFLYLLGETPTRIQVVGRRVLKLDREDAAFINLEFPSGVIGNIIVSWADANKERWLDIVGSKARIAFDDLNNLEPIRIYHKGVGRDESVDSNFGEFKYLVRDGDIVSPRIDAQEPLKVLCEDFVGAVRDRRPPVSDARLGRDVVAVLSRIDAALRR